MLSRQVLNCPVCGTRGSIRVVYHQHGVVASDGNALVTVVDYRCMASECSVPDSELLARRDEGA